LVLYGDIDKELEKKFRIKVVEKYGGKKNALTLGLEDAIKLWLKS
jgi:hypothetical protein